MSGKQETPSAGGEHRVASGAVGSAQRHGHGSSVTSPPRDILSVYVAQRLINAFNFLVFLFQCLLDARFPKSQYPCRLSIRNSAGSLNCFGQHALWDRKFLIPLAHLCRRCSAASLRDTIGPSPTTKHERNELNEQRLGDAGGPS